MAVMTAHDDGIPHAVRRHLHRRIMGIGFFSRAARDEARVLIVICLRGLNVTHSRVLEVAEHRDKERLLRHVVGVKRG